MKTSSTSPEPWPTALLAGIGAVAGIFIATIRHISSDHADLASGEVLDHFLPQMVTALVMGAVVLAGVSAARNWLKRRR